MHILILYYTRTGKTHELAEAVRKGVKKVEGVKPIFKNTEEVVREDFIKCEGIIAGSPVYFGSMAAELKVVFDKFVGTRRKMENKVGAAFTTGGNPAGGKETTLLSILQVMLIYGMMVVGDPLKAGGHYGVACKGNPAGADLDNAERLGERVALLVKKLKT